MNILPKPQKLQILGGVLKSKTLSVKNFCKDARIDKALACFEKGNGAELVIECRCGDSEGYILDISEDKIAISADSPAGAFYGIQTLKQIFENDTVPCLHIEDKPDMSLRGFYHDVTRGKVPTVDTLKKMIDNMAYYKMNHLELYIEHTFPFKELGDSVEKFGYLTPEEIMELDDYCYENFIDFVPSIPTFGHLYELLEKNEYKHLQCVTNYTPDRVRFMSRMGHHTIDPKNPESIEIIKSMIDQVLPLFRTDKFNICCDETFDLKRGKYEGEDTGALYVEFVKKIIDYLKSKGKKVMMWGDILLQHPETIDLLPKDTLFLNWWYTEEPKEETFETFHKSGCTQIVCPGTSTWLGFSELIDRGRKNIVNMLDVAYRYGVDGMINTNWGDYGNPCSLELSMHGFVIGAAKSWNKETKADDEFESSINEICYKNPDAVYLLEKLDEVNRLAKWNTLVWFWSRITMGTEIGGAYAILPTKEEIDKAIEICQSIIEKLSCEKWINDEYREEMLVAAEGYIVVAEMLAKATGYKRERISNTEEWFGKFKNRWMMNNKKSELMMIKEMLDFYENM